MPLPGHTEGHCGYLLRGERGALLFWGDTMHAGQVQFPEPQVAISYDTDRGAAISSRLGILEEVADTPVLVAGAHLDFPGIGRVRRGVVGGTFVWVPVDRYLAP